MKHNNTKFVAWVRECKALELSDDLIASMLGCSPTSITSWVRGRTKVPRYIGLAISAIENDLLPYDGVE